MDIQEFGKMITFERKAKRFTAAELSRMVGISQSYLTLIEQGKRTNISKSIVLSLKVNLSIDEFKFLDYEKINEDIETLNVQEFGKKIATERKAKGITAAQLSMMVGISQSYLSLIEQGKKENISKPVILSLKINLNIDEFKLLETEKTNDDIATLNNYLLNCHNLPTDDLTDISTIMELVFKILEKNKKKD